MARSAPETRLGFAGCDLLGAGRMARSAPETRLGFAGCDLLGAGRMARSAPKNTPRSRDAAFGESALHARERGQPRMTAAPPIAFALDYATVDEARAGAQLVAPAIGMIKVGLEL